jgi:site-specific recombinase XerD
LTGAAFQPREHPNTARRIEDYKAWRREKRGEILGVKEVTLRHDLHALRGFFRYAMKHNWARQNPVTKDLVPSDSEAVRMHVRCQKRLIQPV